MRSYNRFYGLLLVSLMALFLTACGEQQKQTESKSKEGVEIQAATEHEIKTTELPPKKAKSDPSTPTEEKSCSLLLGWDAWEPYLYINRMGEASGLDIDIIKEATKRAGCKLTFEKGEWSGLLKKLKNGEIDIVAGASITESRKAFAYFSEPYRSESFVLYVRSEDFEKYVDKSFNALLENGMRLGVVMDYVYGETVNNYQDQDKFSKQFVYSQIGEASFSLLFDNSVDAVLEDPFVGADVIRRKGWRKSVRKLPIVLHSGEVHLMYSNKSVNNAQLQAINNALAQMRADGSYRQLLESYSE